MKDSRRRFHGVWVFPIVMLLLGASGAMMIASLQSRSDSSRRAQIEISSVRFSIQDLMNAAFSASPKTGGSPTEAHAQIVGDESSIGGSLAQLMAASPPPSLAGIGPGLRSLYPVIAAIYRVGASAAGYNGPGAEVNRLQGTMMSQGAQIDGRLAEANNTYAQRATKAKTLATVGATVVIGALLVAFAFFYFRSVRARRTAEALVADNSRLLRQSQLDALTDSLTGLPNRRALTQDLGAGAGLRAGEVTLGLFDLDGFKTYNDTFGHAAGDALLARLGAKLAAATTGAGKAYRMGGDEFCVLAGGGGGPAMAAAAATLSESGEGWKVGASFGIVSIPGEARDTDDALQVADRRMYADKAARRG